MLLEALNLNFSTMVALAHNTCYAVVLMPYSTCCKLYGDLLAHN